MHAASTLKLLVHVLPCVFPTAVIRFLWIISRVVTHHIAMEAGVAWRCDTTIKNQRIPEHILRLPGHILWQLRPRTPDAQNARLLWQSAVHQIFRCLTKLSDRANALLEVGLTLVKAVHLMRQSVTILKEVTN